MLRQFRLTTLVALFVVIPAVAAAAAPFAYVSNSGAGSVSAIDLGANPNTVTTFSLPGGVIPWAVALNPAATRFYVTNIGNASVYVVDVTTNPPTMLPPVLWPTTGTVVPKLPGGVAVNAAGTRVYVAFTNRVGSSFGGALGVIDAATNTIVSTVAVGMTNAGVTVHPDGSRVYLASSSGVLVLDAAALEGGTVNLLASISVGSRPFGLALNASGSKLYVTNNGSGTVSAVDTGTNLPAGEGFVGASPIGVVLSPDESRLYVTNNASGSLSVLNAATLQPLTTDIALGGAPYGVDVDGGGRIFVANSAPGSNTVWVIDPATFAVSTRTVGASPVAFGRFIQRLAFVETMLRLSVIPDSAILGSAGPVTLTATLTRKDNGAAVSGGAVAFKVDGTQVGSGTTGDAGTVSLAYNPSALAVGAHAIRALFAESPLNGVTHKASEASGSLSIGYQFAWRSPTEGGTAQAGSSIPVRFSLTDANGNAVTGANPVISSAPCTTLAVAGGAKVKASAAGNSAMRFDASTGQYSFNWKTEREWSGTCRLLIVDTQDGASYSLPFQFK